SPPEKFTSDDFNTYYAFPKDFRVPRTHSWQVGLDQLLGPTQRLSVGYAGAAARELPYKYFYNVGSGKAYAYSNDGRSDYNALLTEYAWRPWHGLQVRATYALSHAIDLDSGEDALGNLPPSVIDPVSNRGSADFDRRHVFQTTASYQLPW